MKKVFNVIFTVTIISTFYSCENIFIEPPKDNPEAIFENIWQTFNEEYAPFEERNVDWQIAYNTFRPQVDINTTDDELFTIISEMLQLLNDGHVSLTAPNKHVFYSNRIMRELTDDNLFNKTVIKSYLEPDLKTGVEESYIYGKVQGENVAYIFFDHVAENFVVLNEFLNKYSTVNGYIIDLRHNQGGDFTYCFSEMGRLTNQSRYVFKSKTKNGKERNDYTEWKEWYIHPKGNYVNKPIIVLTDRYTMSATERCVMAFKTLPKVTVIGDTTNGAHGTMIGRALANGWYYSLVPQKVEMYDGNTYEGIGLAPDIFSKNSISEINNGIDMTLQRAIDKLN
jgi:carboxyl-terminal processing protease